MKFLQSEIDKFLLKTNPEENTHLPFSSRWWLCLIVDVDVDVALPNCNCVHKKL